MNQMRTKWEYFVFEIYQGSAEIYTLTLLTAANNRSQKAERQGAALFGVRVNLLR